MTVAQIPWLELSVLLALGGALAGVFVRDPDRAFRFGLTLTGLIFGCTAAAYLGFLRDDPAVVAPEVQRILFGRVVFALDRFNAPLVPALTLLHFLTALATARTKLRRFSISWALVQEAIQMATFSCTDPPALVVLLVLGTVPPITDLVVRRMPRRVFVLHQVLYVVLLLSGWAVFRTGGDAAVIGLVLMTAGLLVRCGVAPFHCWVTHWFEYASFGNAMLFLAPLTGAYAAFRLVVPVAPDWLLQTTGLVSLLTAFYAAGMSLVQRGSRRFFAFFFLSQSSLVLAGLEPRTPVALTGALCQWLSVVFALGGFGLILRAMEGRFGHLSLVRHHGLAERLPTMAACFLVMGLACVGFPFTLGFVSTELLVDGAVESNVYVGMLVVATTALNGISVIRVYLLVFTGARPASTIPVRSSVRERCSVLTLVVLIFGGGVFPQPGIRTRHAAAEQILQARRPPAGAAEPAAGSAVGKASP